LSFALVCSALGVGGLWVFAPHLQRAAARPAIFLSVLAASLGPALAAMLLVAPRPDAARVRHMIAGVASAWMCIELAGAARRMGIAADSGVFRAIWAPITEEVTKALLLAAVLTEVDRDGDRRAIATAGVAVGAGFAFRENVVYFATALDGAPLPLGWLVLRAVPPVFAHALFGATYGTILAQAAIHARALERAAPRWSLVALVLATLAHGAYNGVAWVVFSVAPDVTIPFAVGWALLALAGAWALSLRVRRMSLEDPSLSERVSIVATSSSFRIDAAALLCAAVIFALWLPPLALPRYLAVVFTPLALASVIVVGTGYALAVERSIVWLLLGIAARPFAAMGEGALSAVSMVLSGRAGSVLASVLGALLWSSAAAWLGALVARARGVRVALVAAAGLATGMVAASIGGNLAAGSLFAPWREMVGVTVRWMPRTAALSMTIAWIAATRPRLAWLAALGAALVATASDLAIARGRAVAAITLAVFFTGAIVAVVWALRRREAVAPSSRA
jgi:hypothetical protein